MTSDDFDEKISELNGEKQQALRQSEIDAMNASLAKLRGDHDAAKQHNSDCKKNKKLAKEKQDCIDQMQLDFNSEEQYESDEQPTKIDYYMESIQDAVQRFENGEDTEDIQDLDVTELQLIYSVLESLNSDEDVHIFDVIRCVKTTDCEQEEQDEQESEEIQSQEDSDYEEDSDSDYEEDENSDYDDDVDNEIENEIYDEIENELGYDFNEEEDFD